MRLINAVQTAGMAEADFLALRKNTIGGTDISAIAGLSPWMDPLKLWLLKRGMIEPDPENKAMRWGKVHEPIILAEYAKRMNVSIVSSMWMRHPDHDWVSCQADGIVMQTVDGELVPVYGLECKTSSGFSRSQWGEEGTDEIPRAYLLQCQWDMEIFDAPYWDVAVLIGGNEDRYYRVNRNQNLINTLLELGAQFYDKVQRGIEPDVDASRTWKEYLASKYPRHNEEMIEAGEKLNLLGAQLIAKDTLLSETEAEVDRLKNEIKAEMKDAGKVIGKHWSCTWRTPKDKETVDYKAVIAEAKVPADLIKKHTKVSPGTRTFRFSAEGD